MQYRNHSPRPRFALAIVAIGALASLASAQRVSLSGNAGRFKSAGPARPGGGIAQVPGGINQGGLDVDDFDYVPDRPAQFQPFQEDETQFTERTELVVVTPHQTGVPPQQWIQEDPLEGYSEVAGTRGLFGAATNVRSVATGQLDADPDEEIVALSLNFAGHTIRVHVADRNPDGTYSVGIVQLVGAESWDYADAKVQLANVDGDERNEILIVARERVSNTYGPYASRLRVLDDALTGYAQIYDYLRSATHSDMEVHPGDVDGDGIDELVVALQGDSTALLRMPVRIIDDAESGFTHRTGWNYLGQERAHLAVGDLDGDGVDEIGIVDTLNASDEFRVEGYDFTGSAIVSMGSAVLHGYQGGINRYRWGAVALDRNANGIDEIAVVFQGQAGSIYRLACFEFRPLDDQWDVDEVLLGFAEESATISLAAGDTDGDGLEDLYVGVSHSIPTFGKTVQIIHVDYDSEDGVPVATIEAGPVENLGVPGDIVPLAIAAGDFDADGFRVRYVRKFLVVADPIPLVLLTAAPTKAGIDQNYDDTSTSYSSSVSSSETVGVTNSVTASVSVGFEAEDLFGLFGASVKGTIETAFESTSLESNRTTLVQGFDGGYDDDVLIFQATLYRSYEYQILDAPDPDLVGTYFTLDRPVDANIYKWTVDFYNASVTPENVLPAELFPHTIGDPATYRNRNQHAAYLADVVSWSTDENTLGQSSGANSIGIEFETEITDESQLTLGAGLESEFKAGGVTVGASFSVSQTDMYSITSSTAALYQGAVGDIHDIGDYQDYSYNFGLSVHQHGVNADANNLPTSQEPGVKPFLVVSYWTHLTGAAY